VYGWGSGKFGALANGVLNGDGTLSAQAIARPQLIPGLDHVMDIRGAANGAFMALKADGTVSVWGDDSFKIIGRGAAKPTPVPIGVTDVSNIKQIAGSVFDGFFLLQTDGSLLRWANGGSPGPVAGLGRLRSLSGNVQEFVSVFMPDGSYVNPLRPVDQTPLFK